MVFIVFYDILYYRLSDAIKMTIAFAILLTYGLQLTVTADLAWQALRKKLTGTAKGAIGDSLEEATDEEEWTPKLTLYYYCMRFGLILGSSEYYSPKLPVGGLTPFSS